MLTEQNAGTETIDADSVPIRFITTDDGRTLLAVAENEDGVLELMTTPITFVQQNNIISSPLIKTNDGNLILQPSIFQISVDGIIGTGVQQAAILPVQTLETDSVSSGVLENIQNKEFYAQVGNTVRSILPTEQCVLPNEKDSIEEKTETLLTTEKNVHKRSPGRPRKDGTSAQNVPDFKCDICGQRFTKQTVYRKHMDHHAEEKPHRCPKCPASFNIPSNFTLHMATHNIGEPKCPECGRKFARMASLKSHMLLHEKEENLFCTECEDAFSTKAQLDAHLKLHSEKWATEDVRKCKLCNKQFLQPALYRLHIREHYRLQTKIVKQTKRGTKHKTMYKCTICLKSFQKPSQLMRHIRVHTGEKPFKCTICSRAFTQKGSLQIHMWQHNGIRPHSCNLCNAKFSQKGNLNAHILRVHNAPEGEPIYGCTYCSCIFKKLGSLNGHIKRMHSNPTEEVSQKCDSSTEADMQATVNNVISQLASLESGISNPADSTISGPTSMNKNDILQQALRNCGLPSKNKNHPTTEQSEPKKSETRTTYVTLLDRSPDGTMRKHLTIKQRCIGNVRWYSCSFCHKEFKKPSDLIRHLRVHTQEKPFKCCFCCRSFALKSTMIAHEHTHTGMKKYACNSCDKTFACHSSLTAHTRLHAKPHKCNECEKNVSSSAVVKDHLKNKGKSKISPEAENLVPQIVLQEPWIISDVGNKISVAHVQSKQNQVYDNGDMARPHKCWVCHAAFRKMSHLKQHYRRHTGERPYKCTKCDRRFTSNSVLKSHLHTHDDTRPYSCSVCNTKFSTQSSMKRHLVTHSNKRPFMCPYCQKTFKTSVNCRKHMKIHKHELAQKQLEQQKTQEQSTEKDLPENKESITSLPENLALAEDMEVSFQPQMAPDFTQAFSDQFQNITEGKEKFLPSDNTNPSIMVTQDISEEDPNNLAPSQTLHADETGTITLPNYAGEQTLTSESIRELEETLNQQLFNIGMNLGLGSNFPRQMEDPNANALESREQPVLNIIYDNSKNLETNNSIFPAQFDSFDMSQITLQPDTEIDIGINSANSTSMASILPRSAQEEQRLIPMTATTNTEETQEEENKRLMVMNSKQNCPETPRTIIASPKYPKVIAKADTTNNADSQNVPHDAKEQKDCIVSCDNGIAVTLPFTENFQHITDLQTQKSHSLNDIVAARNESINIAECDSLLQCHMCRKQGLTTVELKEHLKTHGGTKEYQCSECSLRFCTNGGLSRHIKMHSNKQQWKCPTCEKSLSSKAQLKLHSKMHNNRWNSESVEPDSSQRESTISLDADLASISPLDIKIGLNPSVSEKVLLDTVAEKEIMDRLGENDTTEQKEKKEYTNKCKYCPKTFRKPSDLIRHIRTHTGERPYKCDYCGKSFAVKCTLDSHVKVHTGKKTFCCHVCNSMFAAKGSLKVHMRLHTGSKPFKCPNCDLRFRTSGHRKVHLLKHMREHKGTAKRKSKHLKVTAIAEVASNLEKSLANPPQPTSVEDEVPQNVEYPNLDTITIDTSGLTNQLTFNTDGTILNNNSVLSINESNQLVANLHFLLANGLVTIQTDDTLLPQVPNSDTHAIQDENRVTELVAPTSLSTNETSNNHIVITAEVQPDLHNSSEQTELQLHSKYQADDKCSNMKSVSDALSLSCNEVDNSHILMTAQLPTDLNIQTDQAVQLNNCMSLMQMENMNSTNVKADPPAKKQTKSGQSKKECDICGKTFMKPYQVERHKRIHTGERPYKCELCTKSFAQKSTLQMHQKHHTGDRPHPCPHCEYSFTQKGNLQTHLKRVHQLDILENKKLRKGQQILSAKLTQDALDDTKILNLDDISFVEFLKQDM